MRLALVGAGRWGWRYVQAAAQVDGVELSAICDVDPRARSKVHDLAFSPIVASSMHELLQLPVDAVIVATPCATHAGLTVLALRAGKHVLVEKPMATTTSDAALIVDEARATARAVLVGHLALYHPAVRWLLDSVAKGRIGAPVEYRAVRTSGGAYVRPASALWELGPHEIAIVTRVFGGPPSEVSCRVRAKETELELGFEKARAHIDLSRSDRTARRRSRLIGTEGIAEIDEISSTVNLVDHAGKTLERERFPDDGNLLSKQLTHFARRISSGLTDIAGVEEGANVVDVLCAAERSADLDAAVWNATPAAV